MESLVQSFVDTKNEALSGLQIPPSNLKLLESLLNSVGSKLLHLSGLPDEQT
jgi:hypothetical protein